MDDTERPNLSFGELAQITDDLQESDSALWKCLAPLLMPKNGIPEDIILAGPRPPKQSAKFYLILSNYSLEIFNFEVGKYPRYPPNPNFSNWLLNLARRVEDHAIEVVNDIERQPDKSFAYHGVTEREMRSAIRKILHEFMEARYQVKAPSPRVAPASLSQTFSPALTGEQISAFQRAGIDIASPVPLVVTLHNAAQANRTDVQTTSPNETVIERREKLLADYKLATGNPPDMQIYRASNSGIHKPQFYQWRDGRLPANSKITKRFEAFLRAKKRPIPKSSTSR
jgi:hypothetical protein